MSFYRRPTKRKRIYGTQGTGPKRQIQKLSLIKHEAISNAQDDNELVSATIDGVTIVRMVGNLIFTPTATAGVSTVVIHRCPANYTVNSVSVTNGQAVYENKENILWAATVYTVASATGPQISMPLDVRGMRKLKAGDKIYLSTLGSAANLSYVTGQIIIFGKMP